MSSKESTVTYSVHQHWDPLKVCLVGQSYPPEFYSYINNVKVRGIFEKIAQETEEDYQKLISKLKEFGVAILRPDIRPYLDISHNSAIRNPPPMQPRDISAMIGTTFYIDQDPGYDHIYDHIRHQGNEIIFNQRIDSAFITRLGKDLYFGTDQKWSQFEDRYNFLSGEGWPPFPEHPDHILPWVQAELNNFGWTRSLMKKYQPDSDMKALHQKYSNMFPNHRCSLVDTQGHSDGTYCPVIPGLIVALDNSINYSQTFPGWEIIELSNESWDKVRPFLDLKEKNKGKWWIPGQEYNDDLIDYIETWMNHWVGYVEESVFDVNMLIIDEKNVICNNNCNPLVIDAFNRHGITPHVINFRHRYFWDGGLHCITSDLHREGTVIKDMFPDRVSGIIF